MIVVLVLIVMLSLAAYSFSERMITENESGEYALKQAQARACAESGVEYAALLLGAEEDPEQPLALYHDPAMFAGVSLTGSSSQVAGRFTFVAPYENDATGTRVRAGFIDESSRLNLNAISSFGLEEDQEQLMLMSIPGMTEEVADAILDWIDEDDDARISGAESDTYEALAPPYTARNGAIESLDELLLVQGVTPLLLYGEDANRNGLLDPNENDADATLPLDNGDGLLDPGWAAYFTVDSHESNLQPDGSAKIDVNQDLLADMYDQIAEALGEDEALFITAFALNGATNVDPLDSSTSGTPSTGDQTTDQRLQNVASGMARAISGGEGVVTRAGLDLTQGRTWTFDSLFDLIDAEVEAKINQETKTLKSPWSSSGDPEAFKTLFETLTVTTSSTIEGRVNINEARREVLLGIPFMTESVADSIASSQLIGEDGTPMTDTLLRRATPGWLLLDGLVDVVTMRQLDKYVNAGGDVFRLQVLGHLDGPGPIVRIEATIDRSDVPARIVSRRDLAPLGPGYRPEWLVPAGTSGSGTGIQ